MTVIEWILISIICGFGLWHLIKTTQESIEALKIRNIHMTDITFQPIAYKTEVHANGFSEALYIQQREQRDGIIKYAIVDNGDKYNTLCLNSDAEWEYEPHPSIRTEEFIERTRYESLDEVKQIIQKYIEDSDA